MSSNITILIPTYNKADYISATIESALNQNYSDYEILVVDDCSSDGTDEVVKRYLSNKLRYFRHERNLGPAITYNDGIMMSESEYITILDNDDILLPNHLEMVVEEFKSNKKPQVVFARTKTIDDKGNEVSESKCEFSSNKYDLLNHLFYDGNVLPSPGISFKKEVFNILNKFNPGLIQTHDYDLNVRCLINMDISILPEVTLLYRRFNNASQNLSGSTPWLYTCYDIEVGFVFDNYLNLSYDMMKKVFPHLSHYTEDEIKFRFIVDSCKNPKNEISSWAFKKLINFLDERYDFFSTNSYGFEYKDYINLYKKNMQIYNKDFHKKELFRRIKVIVNRLFGL